MRDRVMIKLGGREVALLPTFGVADAFEDTHGGLVEHLQMLNEGRARLPVRAFLILEAMKAADPEKPWKLERVKETMFERGLWHEDLVQFETDFILRLMYTPEQYLEKKAEREANTEEALETLIATMSEQVTE